MFTIKVNVLSLLLFFIFYYFYMNRQYCCLQQWSRNGPSNPRPRWPNQSSYRRIGHGMFVRRAGGTPPQNRTSPMQLSALRSFGVSIF